MSNYQEFNYATKTMVAWWSIPMRALSTPLVPFMRVSGLTAPTHIITSPKVVGVGMGVGYIGFTPSVHLPALPYHMPCPLCNAYSSGWILALLATIISSMSGGVVHNDLWPLPISSRSFNHDFAIKLLKIYHFLLCPLYSMCSSGRIHCLFLHMCGRQPIKSLAMWKSTNCLLL